MTHTILNSKENTEIIIDETHSHDICIKIQDFEEDSLAFVSLSANQLTELIQILTFIKNKKESHPYINAIKKNHRPF